MHDRLDDRLEVETLLRQEFVALGCFHIGDASKDAEANEFLEPVCKQMSRNSE